MDENGNIIMKLAGVDIPDKINNGNVETCCLCGGITIAGIYEFMDPTKVYFSPVEENTTLEFDLQDDDDELS